MPPARFAALLLSFVCYSIRDETNKCTGRKRLWLIRERKKNF